MTHSASVIARRTLTAKINGGPVAIEVRLHRPVKSDANDDWECRYEIEWPHAVRRNVVGGVDSVQALLLAFNLVAVDLHAGQPPGLSGLTWLEPGGGFGFPLPPSLRDLARGDDRLI